MANKSNSAVRFIGKSTACQSAFRFYLTFSKNSVIAKQLGKIGNLKIIYGIPTVAAHLRAALC